MNNVLGYDGKIAVVTGAASGMGEAVARIAGELGAEVYALDVQEGTGSIKNIIKSDLKDRASIDNAIKKIPDRIDFLFNCAGLPGDPFSNLDTTLVNFIGHRHLTESLLSGMNTGGGIAFITSVAGMGWKTNIDNVKELLATKGFEEGRTWLEENPEKNFGYLFSKQCIIVYTKMHAIELAKKEIRINCLSPAPTQTPMIKNFHNQATKEFIDEYFCAPVGRYATPEEMAEPLILLNSSMASFVSGQNLFVDYGYKAGVDTGQLQSIL